MSDKVQLVIKGLSYSQTQSGAYALVLGEEDGVRRLPVIIGGFEAQSIAIALENEVEPPRPLTHDLFCSFAENLQATLKEVLIHDLKEGVFYSIMVFEFQGKDVVLDARTSDAVALAIRFKAPIYTFNKILEKAGVVIDEKPVRTGQPAPSQAVSSASPKKSLEELQKDMEEAVRNEDYEKAARLRDEIDKYFK
jgi:bifunctional DNase/RNase